MQAFDLELCVLASCRLMRCNFSVMRKLGDRVLRPFLQVCVLADIHQLNRVLFFSTTARMLVSRLQHT